MKQHRTDTTDQSDCTNLYDTCSYYTQLSVNLCFVI